MRRAAATPAAVPERKAAPGLGAKVNHPWAEMLGGPEHLDEKQAFGWMCSGR